MNVHISFLTYLNFFILSRPKNMRKYHINRRNEGEKF